MLEQPCPECGFDAGTVDPGDVGQALRDNAVLWTTVLGGPGATARRRPDVWSPTEYAAHVRDVHRVFDERLARMLAEDDPSFASWDQDVTAVEQRYDLAVPAAVADELAAAAHAVADRYDAVPPDPARPHRTPQRRQPLHGRLARAVPPARRRPPRLGRAPRRDRRVLRRPRRGVRRGVGAAPRPGRGGRRRPRGAPGRGSAGARDRERGRTRRRPPRGARARGATHRRHARLRRPAPGAGPRGRGARPAHRRRSAGPTTGSGPTPPCCTWRGPTCPSSSAGWPRRCGPVACSASRSRRATARAGRPTAASPHRGCSPTGGGADLEGVLAASGWRVDDVVQTGTVTGSAPSSWLGVVAYR